MGKMLFSKAVDKSLLRAGLTIPTVKQDEIADALGVRLAKGERTDVDILMNGVKYRAKYTHVALKAPSRDVYQIRYSEGNPICAALKARFGSAERAKSQGAQIEVWSEKRQCLEFRFVSDLGDTIKEDFLDYLGPEDSLHGYQKSYKLVFCKCYFSEALYGRTVDADLLTRFFRQYYIDRKREGKPVELGNVDSAVLRADAATVDSVYSLILRNPYKAISTKGFFSLEECDGKAEFAIDAQLFAALGEEDLQTIRNLVAKKLRLYYSRGAERDTRTYDDSTSSPVRMRQEKSDGGQPTGADGEYAVAEEASSEKNDISIGKAWLLTWNPKNWNWDDYAAGLEAARSGEQYEVTWSCSNSHVEVGDQVYLMLLGDSKVKGIIAAGQSTSKVFEVPHWDPEKAKTGKKTNSIRVSFDKILDFRTDMILGLSVLQDAFPTQKWDSQSSGIAIKEEAVPGLRKMWEDLISQESNMYDNGLELYKRGFIHG